MSLRTVLIGWIEGGIDPEGTAHIDAESQRELCADIYDTERDFLIDALAETFGGQPAMTHKLIASFRGSDFIQMGAVLDEALRNYLIGSRWLTNELIEVKEQESFYDGDQ